MTAPAEAPGPFDFRARLLLPLDLSTVRGKSVAAIVILRLIANLVHFVFAGFSINQLSCLWYVADQLVVTYAVSFIADAAGERKLWGTGVRVVSVLA